MLTREKFVLMVHQRICEATEIYIVADRICCKHALDIAIAET